MHFHISYKLKECLKEIFWGIAHGMLIGAALFLIRKLGVVSMNRRKNGTRYDRDDLKTSKIDYAVGGIIIVFYFVASVWLA